MTRQQARRLAHSYADELPAREPCPDWCDNVRVHRHVEPVVGGWREVREILAGFAVLVLVGVAFWLWTAIGAVSQVPVR